MFSIFKNYRNFKIIYSFCPKEWKLKKLKKLEPTCMIKKYFTHIRNSKQPLKHGICKKYVKIRFKKMTPPCHFFSSRGQKGLFLFTFWFRFWWCFSRKDLFTQQIYDLSLSLDHFWTRSFIKHSYFMSSCEKMT